MAKIRRDHDTGKNKPSAKYANRNPGYRKGDQRSGGGGGSGGGGKNTGAALPHERSESGETVLGRRGGSDIDVELAEKRRR